MSRFTVAFLLAVAFPFTGSLRAQPLDWIERCALSNNRDAVLAELIPGSEEH